MTVFILRGFATHADRKPTPFQVHATLESAKATLSERNWYLHDGVWFDSICENAITEHKVQGA